MKVLRCHVGHTTIFHRPFPSADSAVLLRKLTNDIKRTVPHFTTPYTFCASRDGPRSSDFLRKVPKKVFLRGS